MSQRNSFICIAKDINMDRNYKNTLALNQGQIQYLCSTKSVYEGYDFSFIRTENRIKVQAPFSQIFPANYCYIINQGVRQFFFVLEVKYISDATTEIKVEEDVLTTYKDRGFNFAYCERQHPQSDEMYSNTISEPISPSNLEVNERAVNFHVNPTNIMAYFTEARLGPDDYRNVNWNYAESVNAINPWPTDHGMGWYPLTQAGVNQFHDYYMPYIKEGHANSLLDVLLVPDFYSKDSPSGVLSLDPPSTIHGYTPKNKKLFSYPYSLIQFTNNNGSTLQLKPELMNSNNFRVVTFWNNSECQAFCYPEEYMGRENNYDYGLMISNYPHQPITVDGYTEWLGATSRKFMQGAVGTIVSGGLSIAAGVATGGFSAMSAINSGISLLSEYAQISTHLDDTPDTIKGQSGGDIMSQALRKFTFRAEYLSVTREQVEVIDDFFTRFGYAQSNTMPINVTNPRFHCHYVKTAPGECVMQGIPQEKADIINMAFNSGITFWDSNESFGNYDLKSANTR